MARLNTGWLLSSHDQIPRLFRYIPYMPRTFCTTYDSLFVHVTKRKCFQTQLASCTVSILSSFNFMWCTTSPSKYFIFCTFCVKNTLSLTFPWLFLLSLTLPCLPGSPGEWPPCEQCHKEPRQDCMQLPSRELLKDSIRRKRSRMAMSSHIRCCSNVGVGDMHVRSVNYHTPRHNINNLQFTLLQQQLLLLLQESCAIAGRTARCCCNFDTYWSL